MDNSSEERAGLIAARCLLVGLAEKNLAEVQQLMDRIGRHAKTVEVREFDRLAARADAFYDAMRAIEKAVPEPVRMPRPPAEPTPEPESWAGLISDRPRRSRRRWWQRPAPDCTEWHYTPLSEPTPPTVPDPGVPSY